MPKKPHKVIITITDDNDDTADVKIQFDPPIKDLDPMEIESPALHLSAAILKFIRLGEIA